MTFARYSCAVLLVMANRILAQETPSGDPPARAQCGGPRAAFLGGQITWIGQDLRPFPAKYSGPMSMTANGDRQLSQSYGAYAGACVISGLAAYVDAEMIRGSGVSRASGVAAVTNGDVLRQGSVDLGNGPYVARAFLRWTIPLAGTDDDTVPAGVDELPGLVKRRRLEISGGKLAATDLFDVNRYANSTRTQFLDWVLFNNGAWDYAADTRGYTNGVAVAWITPEWSLRVGSFQMPTFANGNRFDDDIARARGDNLELTVAGPLGATVRLLGFENHGRMGRYDTAIADGMARGAVPNIVADDAPGRIKYGVGLNTDVPLADDGDTGAFLRLGWNDGRTESFVFTEVERHASAGLQVSGRRWGRANDVFGIAAVMDGLSADHRNYLAAGGSGFLLGDGRLTYGPEILGEAYVRLVFGHVALSPDVMVIEHPGYNRDRGPALLATVRVNVH